MAITVVLVLGLMPTIAVAQPNDQAAPQAAGGGSYSVSFVKNAFERTEVTVKTVDASGNPLAIDGATLDGANIQLADGDTVSVMDITSGYGLLNVEVGGQRYYLTGATWGSAEGSAISEPFSYETVKENGSDGIYLRYQPATDAMIPVTAVNVDAGDGTPAIKSGQIASGALTEVEAQEFLEAEDAAEGVWYFSGAELRPSPDGSRSGASSIPISSIRLENGYYYVTTSLSDQDQVAFLASDWDVYLLFEPGAELTLTINRSNGAGNLNLIDGTSLTDIVTTDNTSATRTYQVPIGETREIVFTIGTSANLEVTESGQTLFSNADDGYEVKTYTLSFTGESDGTTQQPNNREVTATFTGVSSSFLIDYTHRKTSTDNYHGYNMRLYRDGNVDGDPDQYLRETDTVVNGHLTTSLPDNSVIQLKFGPESGGSDIFIPNIIAFNNTPINLPWPGVDYPLTKDDSSTKQIPESEDFTTTIYDDAGNPQATIKLSGEVTYENNAVNGGYYNLKITNLKNNLKVTFVNLTASGDMRMFGTGVGDLWESRSSGTWERVPLGRGIARGASVGLYVDMPWDSYVKEFQLLTPVPERNVWEQRSLTSTVITANKDGATETSLAEWYGDKGYQFQGETGNSEYLSGYQQGRIVTEPIEFHYVYHTDENPDGDTLSIGSFHYAATAKSTVPAISGSIVPSYEGADSANKIFAGWSLYSSQEDQASHAVYQAGDVILRSIVDADQSIIKYSDTQGEADIHLYPVFRDANDATNASCTIFIHQGGGANPTPVSYSGLVGSVLDRDSVMNLPSVKSTVDSLLNANPPYVLDGGASDSMVTLTAGGNNTFNLYFNSTAEVTVTFESPYGFSGGTGSEGTKTMTGTPGTALTTGTSSIPTPFEKEGYSFLGWTTVKGSTVGQELDANTFVFPSENVTYYAVYMENPTLTFYSWTEDGGWSKTGETQQVAYGGSLTVDQLTEIAAYAPDTITGYSFQGWALNGIHGDTTQTRNLTGTYTADAAYYAIYTPESNISVTLDANGGTFDNGNTTQQIETGSYGDPINAGTPTLADYYFAGWSTSKNAVIGEMDIRFPAQSGLTYYAIWIQPTLEVSIEGEYTYNGTVQTPSGENLVVKRNGTKLDANDYNISYSPENPTDAGTYIVTVTSGGFKGMATYEIQPRELTASEVTVQLNDGTVEGNNWYYTGSAITPTVTVHDELSGIDKDLAANQDFLVTYENNVDTNTVGGTPGITILGVGNYAGSTTATFNIVTPESIYLASVPAQEWTGSEITIPEEDSACAKQGKSS